MRNLNLSKPKFIDKDIKTISEFCEYMGYDFHIETEPTGKAKKAVLLENNKFLGYIQKDLFLGYVQRDGKHHFIFNKEEIKKTEKIVENIFVKNSPELNFDNIKKIINYAKIT